MFFLIFLLVLVVSASIYGLIIMKKTRKNFTTFAFLISLTLSFLLNPYIFPPKFNGFGFVITNLLYSASNGELILFLLALFVFVIIVIETLIGFRGIILLLSYLFYELTLIIACIINHQSNSILIIIAMILNVIFIGLSIFVILDNKSKSKDNQSKTYKKVLYSFIVISFIPKLIQFIFTPNIVLISSSIINIVDIILLLQIITKFDNSHNNDIKVIKESSFPISLFLVSTLALCLVITSLFPIFNNGTWLIPFFVGMLIYVTTNCLAVTLKKSTKIYDDINANTQGCIETWFSGRLFIFPSDALFGCGAMMFLEMLAYSYIGFFGNTIVAYRIYRKLKNSRSADKN